MSRWLHTFRLLLTDALAPLPVCYYLVVRLDGIQLLRVGARRIRTIAVSKGPTDAAAVRLFLQDLRRQGRLPFVPLAVLVDGPRCYLAAWRAQRFTSEQVVEHVGAVRHDAAALWQTVATAGGRQFVVVQGIDKQFLYELVSALDAVGVQTLFVATLTGHLLLSNLAWFAASSRATLVRWSERDTTYLGVNDRGEVFSGALPADASAAGATYVAKAFSQSDQPVPVEVVSVADARGRPWLPARPTLGKPASALHHRAARSSQSQAAYVGLGSLKLLNLFGACGLVLGALWLLFAYLLLPGDPDAVRRYQSLYQQKVVTQQAIDSASVTLVSANAEKSPRGAAVLAAFCQEAADGACLSGISVRLVGDSLVAEATGTAVDDMAVFELVESARRSCAPWAVRLTSVRPEAITRSGEVDTLLSFKLSVSREAL